MSNAFAARQWATMKLFEGVSRHKGKALISLVITTLAMSLLLVAFTLSLTAYNSVKGVSVAQEMTIFTDQGVGSERATNLKETIEKQPGITRVRPAFHPTRRWGSSEIRTTRISPSAPTRCPIFCSPPSVRISPRNRWMRPPNLLRNSPG
ncbi:MAG: hypothetical protein V8S69_03865 [Dakarella massiliensis]